MQQKKTVNEWGFATLPSFVPLSMDAFKSQFEQKSDTTINAKSSLTALPWVMTFQQQLNGGLPVVSSG